MVLPMTGLNQVTDEKSRQMASRIRLLLMDVDGVLREFFIKQRSIGGKRALVFVFVAMSRDEMHAVWRTIDRDLAPCTTADGADFFSLRGTEPRGFALFTDRAGHGRSQTHTDKSAE